MPDERVYQTIAQAEGARAKVQESLVQIMHHQSVVAEWLHSSREMALGWLKAACELNFENRVLAALWGPLNERAHLLDGQADRSLESAVLAQIRHAAANLAWLRLMLGSPVKEGFAERVLGAVDALEGIDAALETLARGDLPQAIRRYETISLKDLREGPDPGVQSKP